MIAESVTGFLVIDKPSGWTSHDVVAKVRGFIEGKVGHAGTLDPMATGLLVLGLGRATRLLRFVQGSDKEYVATAQLGVATDTLDADGAILSREPLPVGADRVVEAMQRFRGEILQIPPMVSARKVEGTRLYELARQGKVVEREARPVTISEIELIDLAPSDYPEITFRTVCSTGTYIRTLADDIGRALGGRAHLTALRRTANGSLTIAESITLDRAVAAGERGELGTLVVPPAGVMTDMPKIVVENTQEMRVRNGRTLEVPASSDADGLYRVVDREEMMLAVYRRSGESLVPEVVLA